MEGIRSGAALPRVLVESMTSMVGHVSKVSEIVLANGAKGLASEFGAVSGLGWRV